ncbi:MAG: SDR family oxidoreductase, partial [Gammaproteobacteria bacterium]|nr:SDR family oxidoreductase [Gammaproteobacteria bacterium]
MRIVVISGGSSGIGKACVEKFLDHGDCVYNFDIEKNDELDKQANYTWLMTDVRDQEAISSSIAQVIERSGDIHVLIASAGKHLSANIENTSQEQLLDIMNLNLFGVFWLIQSALGSMKQHKKGRIITIGSDQCAIAKGNSTAYGMTKAGLLSLTKSICLTTIIIPYGRHAQLTHFRAHQTKEIVLDLRHNILLFLVFFCSIFG